MDVIEFRDWLKMMLTGDEFVQIQMFDEDGNEIDIDIRDGFSKHQIRMTLSSGESFLISVSQWFDITLDVGGGG